MTSRFDDVPDDVPEGDYAEQHQLADGTRDDNDEAVPDFDNDIDADPADVQEQSTPAPVDDEEDRR